MIQAANTRSASARLSGGQRMAVGGSVALGLGVAAYGVVGSCRAVSGLAQRDPVDNVRRIAVAGPRVLVVSVVADPDQIMAAYAAGAACYLTKDHDLGEVADAVRNIASGRDQCPPELAFAMAHGTLPGRPRLSAQERRLLRAYAAGMTLEAAARRTGIRPATAKHYLERIKQKYRSAGRPTYTKLDLAARVREDGLLRHALAGQQGGAAMAAVAADSATR